MGTLSGLYFVRAFDTGAIKGCRKLQTTTIPPTSVKWSECHNFRGWQKFFILFYFIE